MTAHALVDFPTEGFDHFRQAFQESLADDGPARECREARVFRSEEDRVLVLLAFGDTDALARFRAEIEKDVSAGGDMAPPVITELREDDDLVTSARA
ncbi:hypothetical protein EV188_102664 [Actinomycetospora succinea]|uniref:Antibiotic biosynthesis monooxygenase n=1 Tax=Actinomycetospora succinea TaxID=663603 RepID=A0A4R6VIB8_9PSEU|nr:hypothetical protein [Actinomycetospora succinea]TDQ63007.1 hypothetical protein EV188_102664 [Actinomycetospora succinea]